MYEFEVPKSFSWIMPIQAKLSLSPLAELGFPRSTSLDFHFQAMTFCFLHALAVTVSAHLNSLC
jgi:hypothetical protein